MKKYLFLVCLLMVNLGAVSDEPKMQATEHKHEGHTNHEGHMDHQHHSHKDHASERMIDGKDLQVDPDRFNKFTKNLSSCNIAVVSVTGMVCDFCARGIEKTFKKDKSVLAIDVDLAKGKVLVAYEKSREIDFDEIKNKILINGQNATDLEILEI
ncbi:MAG: cation transporter [Pseudomonadales bacterium]|nr:cation transporter [Pseudomonadales bacterium]